MIMDDEDIAFCADFLGERPTPVTDPQELRKFCGLAPVHATTEKSLAIRLG
jgi:hypothetical protein